jgi:hypothetical protein
MKIDKESNTISLFFQAFFAWRSIIQEKKGKKILKKFGRRFCDFFYRFMLSIRLTEICCLHH